MKKIISIFLIVMLMLTFVACKKDDQQNADPKIATEQQGSENNEAAEVPEENKEGGETPQETEPIKEEDLPEDVEPTEEINTEDGSLEVKEKLLGKWTGKSGSTTLTLEFLEGMVTFSADGKAIEGQYAINMEKSIIYVELLAADGMVKNEFPFTYENGELKILNKDGVEVFFKE